MVCSSIILKESLIFITFLFVASKQIKFTNSSTADAKKSSFVKKSAILTSGKDFRFNFETDVNKEESKTTAESSTTKIPELQLGSGGAFKFNFNISETNDELSLNDLSIKN